MSKSNSKREGREEKNKDKSTVAMQERRKKTARTGNTQTSGSEGARGGCSAETNNRKTESATEESGKRK